MLGVSFWAFWYTYCLLSKIGSDGCRETRGTGTRETTCKPRQDFNISKGQIFLFLWLCRGHLKRKRWALFVPLKMGQVASAKKNNGKGKHFLIKSYVLSPHSENSEAFLPLSLVAILSSSSTIEASSKLQPLHTFFAPNRERKPFSESWSAPLRVGLQNFRFG